MQAWIPEVTLLSARMSAVFAAGSAGDWGACLTPIPIAQYDLTFWNTCSILLVLLRSIPKYQNSFPRTS